MKYSDTSAFFDQFTVIWCPYEKQQELLKNFKVEALAHKTLEITIIQKDWPIFPYLNPKDHVFLDLPAKEIRQKCVMYQEELRIDPTLLNRSSEELSILEKIKLQLLHTLLANRKHLVIEDVFSELTVLEIQELLDLLYGLVRNRDRSILLFTTDESIARSPYVDHLEDAS